MVRVGSLDRRVTFERAVKSPDGSGGFTETYPDNMKLLTWANVKPAASSRVEQAAHTYLEDAYDFTIRYRKGFTPAIYQRLKYESDYYLINSVTEINERQRFWIVRAKKLKL